MADALTHETFQPHVGTGFAIRVGEHEDVLTLDEVEVRQPIPGFDTIPFTLTFTGARDDALFHSQTLEMTHPQAGEFTLMISPIGLTEEGKYRYEAIFN